MDIIVVRAHSLAESLHQSQARKSTGRAYFDEHLVKVSQIVESAGGSPEMVAAALLHDAIEDQPDRNPERRILDECGLKVLSLVRECTEIGPGGEDKAPWIDRKNAYLEHLSVVSAGALLISVADKLQSVRDDLLPYVKEQGDSFYDIFKKAGETTQERKANTLWFHRRLAEAFQSRLNALRQQSSDVSDGIRSLISEFEKIVSLLEKN